MSLNESIVEDAALEWFHLRRLLRQGYEGREGYGGRVGEQSRVAPSLTPALSHGERESYSEVVLVGRLREAIRRPAAAEPAIPEDARATLRKLRIVQIERRPNP